MPERMPRLVEHLKSLTECISLKVSVGGQGSALVMYWETYA